MPDDRLRELQRAAQSGDNAAEQRLMCFQIAKLKMQLPIPPTILSSIVHAGTYSGQEVVEKDGMEHPCFKWRVGAQMSYYDLRSGWKVKVVGTNARTTVVRGRQGGQRAAAESRFQGLHQDQQDAVRYAMHAASLARTHREQQRDVDEADRLMREISEQIVDLAKTTTGEDVEVTARRVPLGETEE